MKQDILDRLAQGKSSGHDGFKVPDGYFEGLQARLMEAIPVGEAKVVELPVARRSPMVRRWLAAAACACVAIGGALAYWSQPSAEEEVKAMAVNQSSASTPDTSYIDEVADYTMMDNDDIYAYLSSNDY